MKEEDSSRKDPERAQPLWRSQLMQMERMAMLGGLMAGVAHEINTPLSSIATNEATLALAFGKLKDLLRSHPISGVQDASDELEQIFAVIDDAMRTNKMASERMIGIVRSLRSFARADEMERTSVDIHEGIETSLVLIAHELKGRIRVEKDFGARSPVSCFPNRLNQVFMNILVNAVQAIEGPGGEIRIETRERDGAVRISIRDNGKGIPPEQLPKIFESGFTTKKEGAGTGLGLAICRRIVEDHGGRIEVASDEGAGTTFTIILPAG